MIRITAVEVCDATKADQGTEVGNTIIQLDIVNVGY